MRRVLIAVNADLDFFFRGMEDGGYFDHHALYVQVPYLSGG